MRQKPTNILDRLIVPLRSAAIVLLFFLALIMGLWIVMSLIRIVLG